MSVKGTEGVLLSRPPPPTFFLSSRLTLPTHTHKGLSTPAAPRHGSKIKAHDNKAILAYGTLPKSGPDNGKISLLYYCFLLLLGSVNVSGGKKKKKPK